MSANKTPQKPVPKPDPKTGSSSTEQQTISKIHPIRDFLGKDDNVNKVGYAIDVDVNSKWAYDVFPFQGVVDLGEPVKEIDFVRIISENEQPVNIDFANSNVITGYSGKQSANLKKGINVIKTRKDLVARYVRLEFTGNKALDEDKNQKPDPVGIYYIQIGQGNSDDIAGPIPVPDPEPPGPGPNPEPPKPTEGRVKDWGGDINKGADKWKVVVMNDNAKLYKVVDEKGVNIADLFNSPDTAQVFINYQKWKQSGPDVVVPPPGPGPDPKPPGPVDPPKPPGPNPGGDGVTVEGIEFPVAKGSLTGKKRVDDYHYNPNNGLRIDFQDNPKDGSFVNNAIAVYGKFVGGVTEDEERGFKWSQAPHHDDGDIVNTYMVAIENGSGDTRSRFEQDHPHGYSTLFKGKKGLSVKTGKTWGLLAVRRNVKDGVLLELYDDQGITEDGKPGNKWVQVLSFIDKKFNIREYKKHGMEVTGRFDDDKGDKNIKIQKAVLVELTPGS